jgi:hypothetical protein
METSEPITQNHMAIVILSAILLAVIAVTAVIFVLPSFTPGSNNDVLLGQDGVSSTTSGQGFNTGVVLRPDYANLDTSLSARGLVPVQPPTGTGKANIFQ